jgi:hypothetical protein
MRRYALFMAVDTHYLLFLSSQAQAHPQSLSWLVKLVENSTETLNNSSTEIGQDVNQIVGDIENQSFAGPHGETNKSTKKPSSLLAVFHLQKYEIVYRNVMSTEESDMICAVCWKDHTCMHIQSWK